MNLTLKLCTYKVGGKPCWNIHKGQSVFDIGCIQWSQDHGKWEFWGVDEAFDCHGFDVNQMKQVVEFLDGMNDFEKKHFIEFPIEVTPADELL